jgi:hypothetical protein
MVIVTISYLDPALASCSYDCLLMMFVSGIGACLCTAQLCTGVQTCVFLLR